jgi:hypothetical protein
MKIYNLKGGPIFGGLTGKATVAGIEAGQDGLYFSGLYKDLDIITPIDPGASIYKIVCIGE